jgi:hypothetical protein
MRGIRRGLIDTVLLAQLLRPPAQICSQEFGSLRLIAL